jgi:Ser/Thr protein kinase RdoA (MazF antagonist)
MQPTTNQLRRLARAALDQQGVPVQRLRWMDEHSNHLFRCDTTTGERLVVRVCLPDGRSDAELDAELAWLAALARDTDVTVPLARFSTHVATEDLPAGGRCIAFAWVQGRHCEQRPSRPLVADLGRGLQKSGGRFRPQGSEEQGRQPYRPLVVVVSTWPWGGRRVATSGEQQADGCVL